MTAQPAKQLVETYEEEEVETDFIEVADSPKFKQLLARKKAFLVPVSILFLLAYFTLPVLISYTTILHQPAIGDITWVWIFSIGQFVMTWILCIIYVKNAASYDRDAAEIIEEEIEKK